MQPGTLLAPNRLPKHNMHPACVACTKAFVVNERIFIIDLGSDATFLGVVYPSGCRIAMCRLCRETTMVYRRNRPGQADA